MDNPKLLAYEGEGKIWVCIFIFCFKLKGHDEKGRGRFEFCKFIFCFTCKLKAYEWEGREDLSLYICILFYM